MENDLDNINSDFKEGQEVDLVIERETKLGYVAIINGDQEGVLYHSEVFENLYEGQQIKGFIKKIRDDGKIDLILHKPGFEKIDDLAKKIIEELNSKKGFIPLTDKSSAENIYYRFQISKKTFKKAIGMLYKAKLITIEEDGIRIV